MTELKKIFVILSYCFLQALREGNFGLKADKTLKNQRRFTYFPGMKI